MIGSALLVFVLGLTPPGAAVPLPDVELVQDPVSQDPVPGDSVSPEPVQGQGGIAPEVFQALWLSEQLVLIRDSIATVIPGQDTLAGPERQVARSRVRGWLGEAAELHQDLVELIPSLPDLTGDGEGSFPGQDQPGEGPPEDEASITAEEALALVRSRMTDYTHWMRIALDDQRSRQDAALDSLNTARADAPLDRVAGIDSEARLRNGQLDTLFMDESELLANSEALGIDVADGWRSLEQAAVARADGLTGRLQLAQLDKEDLRQQLADAERAGLSESEVARVRNEVRALERLIEDLSQNLGATSDFLDTRGYSTAAYRQLVIQATGEVTGDILDLDVLVGLLSDGLGSLVSWFRTNGPTVLVRLVIVLVSVLLGRWGIRLVWWLFRALRVVRLPRLASELIGRMLGPLGTILGLGFGLWAIGADATTMLAGAGVAGVVLGFALQDSLANFASGFMILLYRPFDQDDVIEAAGIVGTVRSMGLANTTLITFDNRRVSIPNSKLWGTVIANRSSEPTRRAEAVLRVGFDQDLNEVSEIVLGRLRAHELVLDEPPPSLYVSGAGDSWMEVTVWAWTKNADWWTVTAAMPPLLVAALEDRGIPVPLPVQQLVGPGAGTGMAAGHPA